MIRTPQELARVLAGTRLAGAELTEVPIPLCEERALAVRPPAGVDLAASWEICRERLDETGRWPLGSVCWTAASETWAARVEEENLFSRHFYREESSLGGGVSPDALIAAAAEVELDAALDRRAERSARGRSFETLVDEALATLRHTAGEAPDRNRILQLHHEGELPGVGALQRWLLAWEAAHVRPRWWSRFLPGDRYLEDFRKADDYGDPVLLLLPTADGWETLAYRHFWGVGGSSFGSAAAVALLQRWSERWDAELEGHLDIFLFFRVGRPPATLDEALPLAWEQETLAECTTIPSGVSTLHHARTLVGRDRWALKDRP